ncbi:hypothetical protein D9M72_552830 [compost metagenome]
MGETIVQHFEIELEVETQGTRIEIGRPNIGPALVHDQKLRMVEGALGAPDPTMTFQYLIELGGHCAIDQKQIVDRRHDDVDLDAPARRGHQGADQFAVRKEIGRHQADVLARHRERPHQHLVIGFVRGVRP